MHFSSGIYPFMMRTQATSLRYQQSPSVLPIIPLKTNNWFCDKVRKKNTKTKNQPKIPRAFVPTRYSHWELKKPHTGLLWEKCGQQIKEILYVSLDSTPEIIHPVLGPAVQGGVMKTTWVLLCNGNSEQLSQAVAWDVQAKIRENFFTMRAVQPWSSVQEGGEISVLLHFPPQPFPLISMILKAQHKSHGLCSHPHLTHWSHCCFPLPWDTTVFILFWGRRGIICYFLPIFLDCSRMRPVLSQTKKV